MNVPATAPVLVKNPDSVPIADDPPRPVGLATTCVEYTKPPPAPVDVLVIVITPGTAIVVKTRPSESEYVEVTDTASESVLSGISVMVCVAVAEPDFERTILSMDVTVCVSPDSSPVFSARLVLSLSEDVDEASVDEDTESEVVESESVDVG